MASFTPPTHTEYFAPTGLDRLWSRVPYPRGETVLVAEDGTVTVYTVAPSDEVNDALYAFEGGRVYDDIPADAETFLTSSSQDTGLDDETYPAWLL